MKYYVQYPILFDCNLRCDYCFHKSFFQDMRTEPHKITVQMWNKFRDTHLKDAEEIIVHMSGGEPFMETSLNMILAFIRNTKMEKIDLLSNGVQNVHLYEKLLPYKDRIYRIGLTYHRRLIHGIKVFEYHFHENAKFLKDNGFNVYIKELLLPEHRFEILENKKYWKSQGFDFKVQDFRERANEGEAKQLDPIPLDLMIVDREYLHPTDICACKDGYKNIIIRKGWNEGDILACWHDPKIVGNIIKNEYNPNYIVRKDRRLGRLNVEGIEANYKGTFDRDVATPEQAKAKFIR